MMRMNQVVSGRYVSAIVVAGMFCLWLISSQYISDLFLPSPMSVVEAAKGLGWILVASSLTTFIRVVTGWSLGCLSGVALGLSLTRSQTLYELLHPFIEGLRPIPTVALIPFFILWFGTGGAGQVLLIFIAAFMTLTIHTYNAISTVPLELVRAAWALGASTNRLYRVVVLPFLLPTLKGGFQIAAALAFATGIAAEFMGAQSGLGFLIMVARRTLNTNVILLGTILIALESYFLDLAIRRVFDAYCRWTEPTQSNLQSFTEAGDKR